MRMLTREEMQRGGLTTASRHDMQAIGRMGGRKPKLRERALARRLLQANEKIEVIATEVGVHRDTARRWRKLWRDGEL